MAYCMAAANSVDILAGTEPSILLNRVTWECWNTGQNLIDGKRVGEAEATLAAPDLLRLGELEEHEAQ